MEISRLFWPQNILDEWMVDEKIAMEGDSLTITEEGKTYKVAQAVYFSADVGDGDDAFHLVGRVKTLSALEKIGAECYMDSVILQESAYQVVGGFVGELTEADDLSITRPRLPSGAARPAVRNEEDERNDKELLAKFLIENL